MGARSKKPPKPAKPTWPDILRQGYKRPKIAKSATVADMIATVQTAISEHIMSSEAIRNFVEDLPKGKKGNNCPDAPVDKILKYLAPREVGDVSKEDPRISLAFATEIVAPAFQFERDEIKKALGKLARVSAVTKETILLSLELAPHFDALWAVWFEKIGIPYQLMSEQEQAEWRKENEESWEKFDYSVRASDDEYAIPDVLAVAFPKEIEAISNVLSVDHREKKYPATCKVPVLDSYFKRLHRALSLPIGTGDMERLWRDVDEAWVDLPTDLEAVPVHMMESGYEHPFGVSPDYCLRIRTEHYEDEIWEAKEFVADCFEELGIDPCMAEILPSILDKTDAFVFEVAAKAGVHLNFPMTGQAVPNRAEVAARGGKIFLSHATMGSVLEAAKKRTNKLFAPSSAKVVCNLLSEDYLNGHVLTHELCHKAGVTYSIQESIGSAKDLLEEAKATWLGILAWGSDRHDSDHLERLAALACARVIRMMGKNIATNTTLRNYFREGMAGAVVLHRAGVLRLSERGFRFDRQAARGTGWLSELEVLVRRILNAYRDKDPEALEALTEEYCNHQTNAILTSWMAWIQHKGSEA